MDCFFRGFGLETEPNPSKWQSMTEGKKKKRITTRPQVLRACCRRCHGHLTMNGCTYHTCADISPYNNQEIRISFYFSRPGDGVVFPGSCRAFHPRIAGSHSFSYCVLLFGLAFYARCSMVTSSSVHTYIGSVSTLLFLWSVPAPMEVITYENDPRFVSTKLFSSLSISQQTAALCFFFLSRRSKC